MTTGEHIEEIINYFAISLFGQNTVDEILWDLARNCISKLGFEDCVVYLLDEKRNLLVQKAAYGPKNPRDFTIDQPLEIPLGKGIVGSVALTGVAEIIHDTSKDPRYIQDDAFRYSELCVPIVFAGKVIGIIDSEHSGRNFFTQAHLNTLRLIASLCANKIVRARAEAEKREHEKRLQEAQQKLSGLSLKALRAQINPHFIFNALNAIQYFISEGRSIEALKYLSLFGRFIRRTLESSEQSFLSLAAEAEILQTYLTLERMRFTPRFNFEIAIHPAIDPNNTEIPVLLIQPFVERVLTEGILRQKKQGTLKIDFEANHNGIVCRIANYGISSADAENGPLHYSGTYPTQSWWGIRERIELINSLFQLEIQVGLVDNAVQIIIPARHHQTFPAE